MKSYLLAFLVLVFMLAACGSPTATYNPETPAAISSPTPTTQLAPAYPPVEETEPSPRVAAFYYPWYQSLPHDGQWIHWDQGGLFPPDMVASDYYPILGAYSSLDPMVVAQHFAWMRQAGIGVIFSSWWGQGSREEAPVPLLLEMGERYGIKVAFLIEPYEGRSASQLVDDIKYIYDHFGSHPAFFRTSQGSLWSIGEKQQGLFLMWGAIVESSVSTEGVTPAYWASAMDEIHALPDGGVMITDENGSEWVSQGHFDGSYKYGALDTDMAEPYTFASALPPGSWYIPGINPGFDRTHTAGAKDSTFSPRRNGEAYAARWQAMFDLGVEPQMVAITTFNEWHEGTQIEPAASNVVSKTDYVYKDYESMPPEGYLTLTRQWVDVFLAHDWPVGHKVTFRVVTTSDWTFFRLVKGGTMTQPNVVFSSPEVNFAGGQGDRFELSQPLERAEMGKKVEMVVEANINPAGGDEPLIFEIGRGGLGYTMVEVLGSAGVDSEPVATWWWDGFTSNDGNTRTFELSASSSLFPY